MELRFAFALCALLAASTSWACPACGDKLSVVGGGMSFDNVEQSVEPGSVVVYAPLNSPLHAGGGCTALVSALKDAGHRARLVEEPATLEGIVDETRADIVIAHWSEASTAVDRLAARASPPTVLPVTVTADDAAAAKAAGVPRCVASSDSRGLRKLPKSVDDVLERRRQGKVTGCPVILAGGAH